MSTLESIVSIPQTANVPTLCRQLYAKRIRANVSVKNLFPHHGPGPTRKCYEDWYALGLRHGLASFAIRGAEDLVRVFLRNSDGEAIACAVTRSAGETAELTHVVVPETGIYYVIVQTDALYIDSSRSSRYTLLVTA